MAKKVFLLFIVLGMFGLLFWTIREYAGSPIVKFSVGQNRIVAVENCKGESLPLSPLPQKYEIVYVK